jgi:DNA/RNA-binding domain of Phe-tRNA-synthetase-like protein
LFADAIGPHGSATSDSERTMVTSATKNVLAIVVGFAGAEGLEKWCQRMKELLERDATGRDVEIVIVQ